MMLIHINCFKCGVYSDYPRTKIATCRECGEFLCEDHIRENGKCFECDPLTEEKED